MTATEEADRWFRTTETGEGIVAIDEPHVHPLLRANTWLVRGRDRDLLVDSGLGVVPLRPLVTDLLGGREPVVVLTHDHLDHMGGAHEFDTVWAHPAEAPERPRGSLHGPTLARLLGLAGEDLPERLVERSPAGFDPGRYRLRPVTPAAPLHDGDRIDLGNRALQVLHLPGHSPGSIGLLDLDTRTLFSGDVIYDDVLLDDLDGGDRSAYADSLRRLLSLDIRVVHPGHDHDLDQDRWRAIAEGYLADRS